MRPRTRGATRLVQKGFTLLELIIVIAVIGILATVTLPNLKNVPRRASEAVLKTDLATFREVIDLYRADKGNYPTSLDDLVTEDYLRFIPRDPITQSAETWVVVYEEIDPELPPPETEITESPGIVDVRSGAPGLSLDGEPYGEW